jgi:hypothetical protein
MQGANRVKVLLLWRLPRSVDWVPLLWSRSWGVFRARHGRRRPKEGVKTENNVAGQDGSVVQFKIKRHTPLSKIMKCIVNDNVCQWGRWDSDLTGSQSMKQTPCTAGNENEDRIDVSSSRQAVSTKKGTCHFTPEHCCSNRPRIHSQVENCTSVSPHPDCYSVVFSVFFSFSPSLYCT